MPNDSKQYKQIKTSNSVQINYLHRKINVNSRYVVFLHGIGGNLRAWDDLIDLAIKHDFNVIAIDLRGHGLSERIRGFRNYSLDYFAQDLIDIINSEKIKHYWLVGHCYGGMVCMKAISKGLNPERLVLMNTNYQPLAFIQRIGLGFLASNIIGHLSNYFSRSYIKKHLDYKKFFGTGDYSLWRVFWDLKHTSPGTYFATLASVFTINLRNDLSKINTPTVVMTGRKDRIFSYKSSIALVSRIKNSQIIIKEKWSHVCMLNYPNEVIVEFNKLFSSSHTTILGNKS